MKRLIISVAIIFIGSLILTQSHSILRHLNEDIARTKISFFWQKGYNREVTVQWYVFFLFQYFFIICGLYVATLVAIRYSFKLTTIFLVGFLYWVIKLFMFFYNYDSGNISDWALVIAGSLSILFLIILNDKRSKFKSLI